jgi:tagatose 6-phosphate kinase
MITTVTLNPMLDKTVEVESLERGRIHRATRMEIVAGGKGINVARQLCRLGIPVLATGFLGGETGQLIRTLLDTEQIPHDFIDTSVRTREGVTYREPDGTATAVFEPVERVPLEMVHELSKKFHDLFQRSTWIVCSGSSTGFEADDLYYEAILTAHKYGVMSVLDSYGNALSLALKAVPSLVKPNKHEYEQTFGTRLASEQDFVAALDHLLSLGVQYAVLSDGANGCYAAVRGHYWKLLPPIIAAVNPVGSGDAMVAGILYGFQQGWKFERCLVFGTAAGAANAQKWDVANSQLREIRALEAHVTVKRLR